MIEFPDGFRKIRELQENFRKEFSPLIDSISKIEIPDLSSQFLKFNADLVESYHKLSELAKALKHNPELHFAFITDLKVLELDSPQELRQTLVTSLNDEEIEEKERILNKNLLPFLERLELDTLWIGANHALDSPDNPDRLRHCLVSLRTI